MTLFAAGKFFLAFFVLYAVCLLRVTLTCMMLRGTSCLLECSGGFNFCLYLVGRMEGNVVFNDALNTLSRRNSCAT